ncbi:uncharacterized protein LOC144671693 [Cetorhinus maximus]
MGDRRGGKRKGRRSWEETLTATRTVEMESSMNHCSYLFSQFLIWLLWMSQLFSIGQFMCHEVVSDLNAKCGGNIVLPCTFPGETKPYRVIWQKKLADDYLVVHQKPEISVNGGLPSIYKIRAEMQPDWDKKRNASLTLKSVTLTDSGTYVCYVRFTSERPSEVCSRISLEVHQSAELCWATPPAPTVEAGRKRNLERPSGPKCFNPEELEVSCRHGGGWPERLCELGEGGATGDLRGENCTLRLRGLQMPIRSVTRGDNHECCLGDGATRPKLCVCPSVKVTAVTSGAELTLGEHRWHSVTLLLTIVAAILA